MKRVNDQWRSLRVLLPGRVTRTTAEDLRRSYVSMKNAQSVLSVQLARVERELNHRGEHTSIFKAVRAKDSEADIEYAHLAKS